MHYQSVAIMHMLAFIRWQENMHVKFDDFVVVIQPGFVDGTPEQVPINFLSDVSKEPI